MLVYGRRIRQARRIRRYTASFLADRIDIRQPRLSELENSYSVELNSQLLGKLVSALDFPEAFFSSEPEETFHRGSLLFRSKSTLTDTDAEHLAEYGMIVGEVFAKLTTLASCPIVRLPELRSMHDPVEAAKITRQQFDVLPHEPIANLTRKAERSGVVIVHLGFDVQLHNRLDAFSCWIGEYAERPLVVIRSSASWERLRWSLAHELGHAVLHRKNRDGNIEDEANRFANELLVPRQALKAEWPASATIMSLLPLKEKWGLSIQALIQYGLHLGLIDESRRTSLFKQLSNRKWPDGRRWREREPGYNFRDIESPRLLGKMTEVGFGGPIHIEKISDYLGSLPPLLLQQLIGDQFMSPSSRQSGQLNEGSTGANNEATVINLFGRSLETGS